tara:strand:- start:1858 stop:2034 length:177 start_codon:yes stop_codon:yes gene_type:complete
MTGLPGSGQVSLGRAASWQANAAGAAARDGAGIRVAALHATTTRISLNARGRGESAGR